MTTEQTDKGVRPGLLVLVVCVLAAIMIPLGLRLTRSRPARAPEASPALPARIVALPLPLPEAPTPPAEPSPLPLSPLAQKWGIQVTRVGLTRADTTLDLRYQVIAPEKAAALAESTNVAYLVDRASGARIQITPPRQEMRSLRVPIRRPAASRS